MITYAYLHITISFNIVLKKKIYTAHIIYESIAKQSETHLRNHICQQDHQ